MKIREEIHSQEWPGDSVDVRYKDIPQWIHGDDILHIERSEAVSTENNSYQAYTALIIYREREETESEKNERLKEARFFEEEMKKRRYENYLKLKAEFEGI